MDLWVSHPPKNKEACHCVAKPGESQGPAKLGDLRASYTLRKPQFCMGMNSRRMEDATVLGSG